MTVQQRAIPLSLPENIPAATRRLLPTALKLIEECFPGTRHIRGALASDPEVGDEWLELQLTLEGEVNELLAADIEFGKKWLAAAPFPDHHLIRVFFHAA